MQLNRINLTVCKEGTGDFISLTEAIESLPMYTYERVYIYVKNGIYNERIRIEQNHITIIGESREKTIIEFNMPRPLWNKQKDHIGPGIINIHADDFVLKNLTVKNTQTDKNVHAFVLYGDGTRIITDNCSFISEGGDTVALWNYKHGMYYHNNCYFKGAVDFVCPRGWCYINNSTFYEVHQTAAIWHTAVDNPNQKLVIKNSTFDGVSGYYLGRHHYDAAFYLINCDFSETMINKPLYQERSNNPRPYFFGDRHYYKNCHRDGGDYKWHEDNLDIDETMITASWTFDDAWNPLDKTPIKTIKREYMNDSLYLYFDDNMTVSDELIIEDEHNQTYAFKEGHGRNTLRFESTQKENLNGTTFNIKKGFIEANTATVNLRVVDLT